MHHKKTELTSGGDGNVKRFVFFSMDNMLQAISRVISEYLTQEKRSLFIEQKHKNIIILRGVRRKLQNVTSSIYLSIYLSKENKIQLININIHFY